MRYLLLLPVYLLLGLGDGGLPGTCVRAQSDFITVKNRVLAEIRAAPYDTAAVDAIQRQLSAAGTWPDLDYTDASRTGFQHHLHLDRLLNLTRAYTNPGAPEYRDAALLHAIERGLSHWIERDYRSDNWWYNQVYTPKMLVTILLLLDPPGDDPLLRAALPLIDRATLEASGARPGGDRIKLGATQALRQLLTGDESGFAGIMRTIDAEVAFATGERGLQHDYSFHHRADRVNNTTSYGRSHADTFAEWAAYVAGTTYAFSAAKQRMLVDYYLDGIAKQYVYGAYPETGVRNRDISRPATFAPLGVGTPERLLTVTDYRSAELRDLIAVRRGERATSATFAKFFWQTEHFVAQRPGFYASVRMYSRRNANMESPYNEEGLLNHHRGDGANFLARTGEEYLNVWPVYDWQKIPGTTVAQKSALPGPETIQHFGLTEFVGAVTDGTYGAVGFDFVSPHDLTRARKAWFFFDDRYVCLGAGIESFTDSSVVTTLEQNRLRGPVLIGNDEEAGILEGENYVTRDVRWVHHRGTGYLLHGADELHLTQEARTGYWTTINRQWDSPRAPVTDSVFTLWIDHGRQPQRSGGGLNFRPTAKRDVTYAYSVVPGASVTALRQPAPTAILANDRGLQAVHHAALGLTGIVAHRAGTVTLPGGTTVTLDGPGAVLLKSDPDGPRQITVADPARNLSHLYLRLSGPALRPPAAAGLEWRYDGAARVNYLRLRLPSGVMAGSSVGFSLR